MKKWKENQKVVVHSVSNWDGRDEYEVCIVLDCLEHRSADGQRLYRVVIETLEGCAYVVKDSRIVGRA